MKTRFFLFCIIAVTVFLAVPILMAEPVPVYQGFSINPPPDWVVWEKRQRLDHALWGKIDKAYLRHSTIAEVRISPPAPSKLSMENLLQMTERKLKKQETSRIKDFHFELKQGSRRGTPTLELRTRCIDTGVNPAAQLHSRGFMLITPDNRLLVATVSERSDQANFQFDEPGAEKFLDAVSW